MSIPNEKLQQVGSSEELILVRRADGATAAARNRREGLLLSTTIRHRANATGWAESQEAYATAFDYRDRCAARGNTGL